MEEISVVFSEELFTLYVVDMDAISPAPVAEMKVMLALPRERVIWKKQCFQPMFDCGQTSTMN